MRFVIFFLCALIISCNALLAHDHEHPELNTWFQSLRSKKGLCCDGNDALHLKEVQWETKDGHYRVAVPADAYAYNAALHGESVTTIWVDVPDDAVIDEPNKDPEGQAMVWPIYGYNGPSVRCFLPGTLS